MSIIEDHFSHYSVSRVYEDSIIRDLNMILSSTSPFVLTCFTYGVYNELYSGYARNN